MRISDWSSDVCSSDLGKIVMRTIPDKNTQLAELMTGGVDWIWKVDKDQAESIRSAPNLTVKDAETMRIGYVTFDAAGKAGDRKSTRLNSRHSCASRMPSSS